MKPGIHPPYRLIVFRDRSASHPCSTGRSRTWDTGRVEQFQRRSGNRATS